MPINTKLYRVLIASPGDVIEEREIIREEINRWNSMNTKSMKITLLPIGWETDATPDLRERGQAVINRQLVDNCDILIGIFWTRIGTPTPKAKSGTVEEIERALAEGKRCMVYFSDKPISPSTMNKEQSERLEEYKQDLKNTGLTSQYKDTHDFKEQVFRHINNSVLEIEKEDKERRAAEQEAKTTEQALGLHSETNTNIKRENITLLNQTKEVDITFTNLSNAQRTVRYLLTSPFGIQDMEDAKEREINKIKEVLNSPDLATLFNTKQVNSETISPICQIMETASTPSMFAVSSIAKYGDDSSIDWLEITGDWIERLSTRIIENGYYQYVSYLKTYPALLLLYSLGISALRSGNIYFLKELTNRRVYLSDTGQEVNILYNLNSRYVFYNDLGKFIKTGFETKYTPVSDHLAPLIKNKLYPHEEDQKYINWFDLFEFLISLKFVEKCNCSYLINGSFVWRHETKNFIIKAIQGAVCQNSKLGKTVLGLFDDITNFKELAHRYDSLALEYNSSLGFDRSYPSYISELITRAEKNT
ncbi:DUF4062 domain-containing protein (plasmid) [Cyanobacterium sp. IPPAS B-1200]|uniref:DUF4062 domain-containing protein n=1 Tax=Cyanobacterium sp. IPPAS B-1200 TaxID=1562720 RepID=UPI00085279B8|nr:DUF4062 domain-containing protein [Cyanobacterium sp. IPPAS B-1200]OEJ77834.1 hypothetical protein A5482_15015 [Cyanobacterium sp. IPPAS B-1200]